MIYARTAYLFVLLLWIFSSCGNKDTIAEVTVRNGNNNPLEGVEVLLIGDVNHDPATDPPLNIQDSATTNSEGVAVFDFTDKIKPGQNGFVVADVVLSYNGFVLLDKMIIYQEQRNEETFYFTP